MANRLHRRTCWIRLPLLARLGLIAALTWSLSPPPGAAQGRARARPSADVKTLLNRAAQEPPARAEKTLDEAAQLAEQTHDPRSGMAVAQQAEVMGRGRSRLGDLAGARRLHQRALAIRQKLRPNSVPTADSLADLGFLARRQGDLAGAQGFFQRALAILERRAPDSPRAATSLNSLGVIARSQGNLTDAQAFHQRALAIREKHPGQPLMIAQSLDNLGLVALDRGDLSEAKGFLERAVAIREQQSAKPVAIARGLNNLGCIALAQRAPTEAKRYFERALALREKLGPFPLEVAISLTGLSRALDENGARREAIEPLRQAVQIVDGRAPHALMARFVLRDLAGLLLKEGAAAEAERALKRAEEIEAGIKSVPQSRDAREASALSLILPQLRLPASQETRDDVEADSEGQSAHSVTLPEVRILAPQQDSNVSGEEVNLSVVLVAPLPLARCRVRINGRAFGPDQGISLPIAGQKQRIGEKGLIMSKDLRPDHGSKQETPAQHLPREVAALVQDPHYTAYQQLDLTLPLEETDGESVTISLAAETTAGSRSHLEILHLHRPQAAAPRGALRVLAVGVGQYANRAVPRLDFAAADARDLAAALQSQAGDGKLYGSVQVKVLTDADATLPALRQALKWLTDNVQTGETLLLLLSGHGVKEGDKGRERFYFAPVGLDPTNISGTGLPWQEVLARLEAARQHARVVWLLADCCRAASGLRQEQQPSELPRERQVTGQDLCREIEEGGNLVICTAATGDRLSYESPALQHGLFTKAWLEALRGEAGQEYANLYLRGRVLTLSRLQVILDERVQQHASEVGKWQAVEFPMLLGSFPVSQPAFLKVPASQPAATR
jgi:uncharacterized caspase-like protein/tetratricopeptide (TPR) repeat protein